MMWDAWGNCRRGQESDQSPEPEMIRTDPSTAGGRDDEEEKNHLSNTMESLPCILKALCSQGVH